MAKTKIFWQIMVIRKVEKTLYLKQTLLVTYLIASFPSHVANKMNDGPPPIQNRSECETLKKNYKRLSQVKCHQAGRYFKGESCPSQLARWTAAALSVLPLLLLQIIVGGERRTWHLNEQIIGRKTSLLLNVAVLSNLQYTEWWLWLNWGKLSTLFPPSRNV